jgi:hypothetical protein
VNDIFKGKNMDATIYYALKIKIYPGRDLLKPQNIEQGISNIEVWNRLALTLHFVSLRVAPFVL